MRGKRREKREEEKRREKVVALREWENKGGGKRERGLMTYLTSWGICSTYR